MNLNNIKNLELFLEPWKMSTQIPLHHSSYTSSTSDPALPSVYLCYTCILIVILFDSNNCQSTLSTGSGNFINLTSASC